MPNMPKVKYWSSSPLIAGERQHLVLLTVKQGEKEQTAKIATCHNGAVSKRLAELLEKAEGQ